MFSQRTRVSVCFHDGSTKSLSPNPPNSENPSVGPAECCARYDTQPSHVLYLAPRKAKKQEKIVFVRAADRRLTHTVLDLSHSTKKKSFKIYKMSICCCLRPSFIDGAFLFPFDQGSQKNGSSGRLNFGESLGKSFCERVECQYGRSEQKRREYIPKRASVVVVVIVAVVRGYGFGRDSSWPTWASYWNHHPLNVQSDAEVGG